MVSRASESWSTSSTRMCVKYPGKSPKQIVISKRDSTKSGGASRHVSWEAGNAPCPPPMKLTRSAHRQDASHPAYTLDQRGQILHVGNRESDVDGSCRLRLIGSGVHHLDGNFFTGSQVTDVTDQALSVDRDNVEGYGLCLGGIRPGRSDQPVGAAGAHALQTGAVGT